MCNVQELLESRFCSRDDMNDTEDNSRCRLREQLFLTVTVPACKSKGFQQVLQMSLLSNVCTAARVKPG